ncbi:MAG: selenium metabolism-associated LysR family transcriptional regulator [Peptococcaceae bacterium]|jgi:DNA-binding transcriptional LysR family regulator|nr:selenium metabolism-associated LysR family transcriptional regulator [Peptococcaceae bacterium]MDH7524904.1 selenium metabolism-associated LysR family transcriptional regulator [Peptococcaceae bacterium]
MDFRQIEAFLHVSRLKSFSKAGDALYLTQPTISAHINSLESELGVKLFDRSSKDITLTRAGEIFYDYAVDMINTRDTAVFSLNDYTRRIEGRLEVASSTIPAQYLLPGVIKAFSQKHANVKYSLVQMDTREVLERILEKEFEIGVVGSRPDGDKMVCRLLCEDELVLIAPSDDSVFSGKRSGTLSMQEIEREPFIMRESGSGTRKEFEKALQNKGYDPGRLKTIAQANSTEAVIQAVRQGVGVSVVSSLSISDYVNLGLIRAFRIKDLELKRAFYMVTVKNRPLSPVVQAFKEFLTSYFQGKTAGNLQKAAGEKKKT